MAEIASALERRGLPTRTKDEIVDLIETALNKSWRAGGSTAEVTLTNADWVLVVSILRRR